MPQIRSIDSTIYALSSGAVPAGVAIIRISGPSAANVFSMFHVKHPLPRMAVRGQLMGSDGDLVDEALLLWFPAPKSFTGENVVELHCHGGPTVIQRVYVELEKNSTFRMAEPGEFSRQAFENGKMDLTEVEGLGDLLVAETEAQRQQAINQYSGALRTVYEGWRLQLLSLRASVEADFDFSDEEDVPGSVADDLSENAKSIQNDISIHLNDCRAGEIIRDGLNVALLGPPNAGKSSLLNYLAKDDLAIVTAIPGTTRDVLKTSLDLDGFKVNLSDTAGLRASGDEIEIEGMRRAIAAANKADVILWLSPSDSPADIPSELLGKDNCFEVVTKMDLGNSRRRTDKIIQISTLNGRGVEDMITLLTRFASVSINDSSQGRTRSVITRARHREALAQCVNFLDEVMDSSIDLELRADSLRRATDAVGRVLGRIDVEDILGHIFSEFCIGK